MLADTHSPRFWKRCPPAVAEHLRTAELILHAGDVCTAEVLDELSAYAPVRVVLGNNDRPDVATWGAEPTLELDLDGLKVGMIHDSGPATGRLVRLRRRLPHRRPGDLRTLPHPDGPGGGRPSASSIPARRRTNAASRIALSVS